jgi:hypothetical protein
VDNTEPTLTPSEPPPEDTRALADQPKNSLEIPETPAVALDNMRPEEDAHEEIV